MRPNKRASSTGGGKPTPELPFSLYPFVQVSVWAHNLSNCTEQLWVSLWESPGPPVHLQVGDVAVNVHGGRLTVLRDVLVILRARLPVHTIDTGNGHILIASSHIPGRRKWGWGARAWGKGAPLGAREGWGSSWGIGRGLQERRGWFWRFTGVWGVRLPDELQNTQ